MIKSFAGSPRSAGLDQRRLFRLQPQGLRPARTGQERAARDGAARWLVITGELAVHQQRFWQCMDTYREMQLLNEMWQSGRAPWRVWN
jgi:hypothetical protein